MVFVTVLTALATAIASAPPLPMVAPMLPATTVAFTRPALTALTPTTPTAVTEPPWMAASTTSAWVLLASATATATERANPEPAEMLTLTATTTAVADGVVGVSAFVLAPVTSTAPFEINVEAITRAATCTAGLVRRPGTGAARA